MKPTQNRVMIEPHVRKTTSLAREDNKLEKASVVALGPDVQFLNIGDVILYKSYEPSVVEIEGNEYVFIKEDDVLATCPTIITTNA